MLVVLFFSFGSHSVNAKDVITPKMYMFGFAASFSDTIVHFTDIQQVDSVWIDKKTKFLIGRENYSYQLRNHLSNQQLDRRTCVVIFDIDRSKLEKKLLKMRKQYGPDKNGAIHYDVRILPQSDFHFKTVSYAVEMETAESQPAKEKKSKKEKRPKGGRPEGGMPPQGAPRM